MMSLDEAYLDFGQHLALRKSLSRFEKSVIERLCDECVNLQKIFAEKRAQIGVARERIRLEEKHDNATVDDAIGSHEIFDVFQVARDRVGQRALRTGQPPGRMAPPSKHAGNRRIPSQATR